MKKVEVSIIYDTEGNVVFVGKNKLVSEEDYKKLVATCEKTIVTKDTRFSRMVSQINELKEKLNKCEEELKVLKGEE